MKKILNRVAINEISLTVSYLIVIIVLVTMETYIRLLTPGKVLMKGVACIYDVIINSDIYTVPLFIIPFILYYIINILKNEFNIMRVVRKINVKQIWVGCIKELLILDIIFTIYITSVTIISGLISTGIICNWSEENSFGYNVVGKPIYNYPSFVSMIIAYAISIFCLIFVLGVITLFVWWYLKSSVAGFIVAYIVLFIDGVVHVINVFYSRYIMSFRVYKTGIDIFDQIIYPICLCIIMFVISTLLIKRRDFLDKL